jgi:NADH-quinone oxidoreductase subunit G
VVAAAKSGEAKAVFLTAGYPSPTTINEPLEAPLRLTIDLFKGVATHGAKYVLPAATFAEKDGTFVNHAGLAQHIKRSAKPPLECRTEGQLFFDLLGRRGLVRMEQIRKELAGEVQFFAPLENGIGELGIKLGG